MLHYLAEPHDDPVTWRDVEVLPIIALAMLVVAAVARIHAELSPAMSGAFVKVIAIVLLLGLRKVLGQASGADADQDGDGAAA